MPEPEPDFKIELSGETQSGRTVVVMIGNDHYTNARIWIDGEEATLTERPLLYRDGGTRTYRTDRGTVVFPHKIGNHDHTPCLDGERVMRLRDSP